MTKLVEVALPLEAISAASKRDKDKKTGTIKNVHKWFAPMPTPAWRALLFAALVDDPGEGPARDDLLRLIEELVPDHGGAPSDAVLARAKAVIREHVGDDPPTIFDPFCGGGSTLVEAQRLGLPAAGSDLNPVPTLITRTITNLVPQMMARPALIGDPTQLRGVSGHPLEGFLADCRHYAERVRARVWDEIGHLYPPAPGGGTVIAWLWARTVTCPNPACRAIAPLASSFWLSRKPGAEAWVDPVPQGPGKPVRFEVQRGDGAPGRNGTMVSRTSAVCLVCDSAIPLTHVRDEGKSGRLGAQLMAVAVDRDGSRVHVGPDGNEPAAADRPEGVPDVEMPEQALGFRVQLYGMTNFADLFTDRQLVMLDAFARAIARVADDVAADGGDEAQATAIASVLGLALSKLAMNHCTQARLETPKSSPRIHPAFSRHALPMVWDYAETNPFSVRAANWSGMVDATANALRVLAPASPATVFQSDARDAIRSTPGAVIATDPPYFDHIGYADLSDFFYVWLRVALAPVHRDLFATIATPKAPELIASPFRHGGRDEATKHFITGFTEVFGHLREGASPDLPMLVVYASRQHDADESDTSTTAWDAMLSAILAAGLRIVMTWPIHATTSNRQIGQGTNAMASYVVLVCRPKEPGAEVVDRQRFVSALRTELPHKIRDVQAAAISTIDLGQAALGAGMQVFSSFDRVLDTDGSTMTVTTALRLISEVQGEILDEFVGDLDRDTRWAMLWYREHGFSEQRTDDAEKLCRTTNTSIESLQLAGIIRARGGKVNLVPRDELDASPVTAWELTQHLVRALTSEGGGGEVEAAALLRANRAAPRPVATDDVRDLAYWLSARAVSRGDASEALAYDALTTSWREVLDQAAAPEPVVPAEQQPML